VKVGDMVRVTRPSLSNRVGDVGIVTKVFSTGPYGHPDRPAYKIHFQPCYTRTGEYPQRTVGESYLEKVVG